jgi:2-polyprenyl-6-methoxyphenol hydroxylase-like FAD-dependent oxidoreductase
MNNVTSTLRVIIVGGGVAGLTLASSLQRTNVQCVLLEARNEIAPLEGASIAINANGGRILDQIGALDDIYNVSAPCLRFEGYKDGRNFESNDFLRLNLER